MYRNLGFLVYCGVVNYPAEYIANIYTLTVDTLQHYMAVGCADGDIFVLGLVYALVGSEIGYKNRILCNGKRAWVLSIAIAPVDKVVSGVG